VFVYPSRSEGGWSISVLEAMAAGLPVVVSSAVAEMAAGGRGRVVDHRDLSAIAGAVADFWHSPAELEKTSARARAWARAVTIDRSAASVLATAREGAAAAATTLTP
jgi:glycosyltransferase involved in cell wall biosynthesis